MTVLRRRLGLFLIWGGLLTLAYAVSVVAWRDPVTDVYTAWEQHEMGGQLAAVDARFAALARADGATREERSARRRHVVVLERRLAAAFSRDYARRTGAPIGRIRIHRIGLGTILVQSTDYWASLTKGPGHYAQTPFPGQGRTVAIAGHRTTWSAPFRHVDDIRQGDAIVLEMPYGTFTYRVTGHRVVRNDDWSIVRNVGHEQLVISACHPLYSASHRWVVFARLVAIAPPGGAAVAV
jgi:sortase A